MRDALAPPPGPIVNTEHRLTKRIGVRTWRLLLLLTWLLCPAATAAIELVPFRVADRSPVVRIYGLPPAGDPALLSPGEGEAALSFDLASNFVDDSNGGEWLILDGETTELTLSLRYGLGERFEATLDVPWVSHDPGFLDSFIDDWHDFFFLPDGGRNAAPEDQLLFFYFADGEERLRLDSDASGMGDLRLGGAWQLLTGSEEAPGLALRGSLKLPTGDAERLLGSGGTDLALWLTAHTRTDLEVGRWGVYGALGLLYAGDGDVLPERQRNLVAFGTLGTGYVPWRWIALKVQLDGHSPFYRGSDLTAMGDFPSLLLTFGGTLPLSERLSLDLALAEDILVDTAPDVAFHAALRHRF